MNAPADQHLSLYLDMIDHLRDGQYDLALNLAKPAASDTVGRALYALAMALSTQQRQEQKLEAVSNRMLSGLRLDEMLEIIYQDFHDLIPYQRIGLALIEADNQMVRSYWAKSDLPHLKLHKGYTAPLAGSSLETILQTRQPRIINDLAAYLAQKPSSASTRLIVEEGFRSSLTCPLVANDVPIGFIFFTSVQRCAYANVHIEVFQRIAARLSLLVEKARLVSELAAQKETIEEQNKTLQQLNEQKNAFMGMAAHDLRNPIGYIESVVMLLSDASFGFTAEDYQSFFKGILGNTAHMLNLLDDLLDVTQIESGKMKLHIEALDLGDFLAQAVVHHNSMARAKGTRVLLEPCPPGQIMADPARLRQVMDNLLSNAVKYSPPGSTVTVGIERLSDGYRIYVQDQGPGIQQVDRQRLFKDFSRLSARPTNGEKSTGLGLAITRRLVEAHGGQIDVDSDGQKGSRFWFTLPDLIFSSPGEAARQ